jgi:phosphoribosylformylglycinamidine synthase
MILRAPGINCERETLHAFELAGAAPEFVHVGRLMQDPKLVEKFSIIAVPGGFAYGDDISAGRVLANQMRNRLGPELLRFVERGGLPLGICNGFQVLVRLGLLPRTKPGVLEEQVSLSHNLSNHYECRWVRLKSRANRCVFLEDDLELWCPAAHAEGYMQTPDADFEKLLLDEGFVTFVYVDEKGDPTTEYPANPNGSPAAIAGLTDVSGRVLGLMPHPDRAYLPHLMPDWRRNGLQEETESMRLFRSMVRVAAAEGP